MASSRPRGVELESTRADVSETAQTLAEVEAAKTALDQRMAELATRVAQEREEAQSRVAKLQEERDRLDARLRRSSAETGKVSDMQKEIDTLLAELADKEESCVALRTGHESIERELEESRAALAKEKEEAAGRLAGLVAQQSDLERQVQEAHEHRQTLERQMASLRAEVVELEVAREEDAERLRELDTREAGAKSQRGDDVREERDRLKRELDAMRVDAENTRRALADSDARLRKLQQEKTLGAARAARQDGRSRDSAAACRARVARRLTGSESSASRWRRPRAALRTAENALALSHSGTTGTRARAAR